MWYTTRQEGFDDPRHTQRSPQGVGAGTLEVFGNGVLRFGLFFQVIAILGLCLGYYMCQGTVMFTYDLHYTTDAMRSSTGFQAAFFPLN
eukprot:Trichotokara_eunicae@DN7670_c0_g1_i1.p1